MRTLISDTADILFKRKSDGKIIFTAEAQLAGISQEIDENDVFAGIGNKRIAKIRSQKNISLSVKMALFDLEYLAMTQGVAVTNGSASVNKREIIKVIDTTGTLSVTVTGSPVDNKVTIVNAKGETLNTTVTTKKATVTNGFALKDEEVTVVYKESVTGNIVKLDSETFSENYEVEYRTIAYNPETNQVVSDIYFQFYNALPSGAFDLSLENGNALAPELKFDVLATQGSSEMGQIVEVPRVA